MITIKPPYMTIHIFLFLFILILESSTVSGSYWAIGCLFIPFLFARGAWSRRDQYSTDIEHADRNESLGYENDDHARYLYLCTRYIPKSEIEESKQAFQRLETSNTMRQI